LTFKPVIRSTSDETGATTGTNPSSISSNSCAGFTDCTSPTNPRSAGVPSIKVVRRFAITVGNARAEIALALIPDLLKVVATSWPT
jgi:hypothetical protein